MCDPGGRCGVIKQMSYANRGILAILASSSESKPMSPAMLPCLGDLAMAQPTNYTAQLVERIASSVVAVRGRPVSLSPLKKRCKGMTTSKSLFRADAKSKPLSRVETHLLMSRCFGFSRTDFRSRLPPVSRWAVETWVRAGIFPRSMAQFTRH
jgi:hypothetical protein